MKMRLAVLGLGLATCVAAGCEPVDYYPHHDEGLQSTDLRKTGDGSYGGNNSNYPVGTPGTPGTGGTTMPSMNRTSPESSADGGPAFNVGGAGAFSGTNSYSGAGTGGAMPNSQPDTPGTGTTSVGTSAGR